MTDNVVPFPQPIPDDETLPCGCTLHYDIVDGEKTVELIQCNDFCPNARALKRAADTVTYE